MIVALNDAPRMAAAVAALSMDAVEKAQSGHPGMPMGMAEAATVLWTRHLRHDPSAPDWPDRDRFVLSAGHGSMLLYSLLALTGYPGWSIGDLRQFRQLGAKAAGHPEYGHGAGIETTTGPLGQGLATAVGMAMAEAHLSARYGGDLVDHRTWVVAGDGCLMEGISHEAIALAGRLRLKKLCVIWDDNGISIDGPVALADETDQRARFEAAGWRALACDGHDADSVDAALAAAKASDRPTLIACRTTIGRHAPLAGTNKVHGSPLGAEGVTAAKRALGWPHPPFEVPDDILALWRGAAEAGRQARLAWETRATASGAAFQRALERDHGPAIAALGVLAADEARAGKSVATRKASETALKAINEAVEHTFGGSADLTGSNNTRTGNLEVFSPDDYAGRYVHYGVREHAMAAAMCGLALHGGVTPYGGTFLVFADYLRPSLRLAALMGVQAIFVLTHDSIGLGEDGPTHQPVETLASLRTLPNIAVFRPADAVETAEAWACALARRSGPSALALTRQAIGPVRRESGENRVARGGYVLADAANADAILIATGSEVDIALAARTLLEQAGVSAKVVSMPCVELFRAQDESYRRDVLGENTPRLVIEAGLRFGWDEIIFAFGGRGDFLGLSGFGASGPAEALFRHFGLTAEAAAAHVQAML